HAFTDQVRTQIVSAIRAQLSAKHVPRHVTPVSAVPVNLNLKKMELLVRDLVTGRATQPCTWVALICVALLTSFTSHATFQPRFGAAIHRLGRQCARIQSRSEAVTIRSTHFHLFCAKYSAISATVNLLKLPALAMPTSTLSALISLLQPFETIKQSKK